jgi:predicted metal-dependent peptidase
MTPAQLTREFDRCQAKAFLGQTAAFFGSILCSLKFRWKSEDCKTAQTDGEYLEWNPDWFIGLIPESRVTVLMHELWHVGLLHMVRCGIRDPEVWNYACDIYINNQLIADGYSFKGIENCWKDPKYTGWTEDDIYDDLMSKNIKPPPGGAFGSGSGGDLKPSASKSSQVDVVNNVVRAMHQQKISGGALPGLLPGNMEEVITQFLKPVVPWQVLLERFFNDLQDTYYSWARPNRRYPDMYLPSPMDDTGKLEHLAYFLDTSGSIKQSDAHRFSSEVAYVKDKYEPQKMTLVQFTTEIVDEMVINDGDRFTDVTIKGRGGTSLIPVREWIIKHKPTAAIIFTDLEVRPMEPLPYDIPVIWVVIRNPRATVPFGKIINIT